MKTTHILSLSLLPVSLLLVSCGQDAPTSLSPSDVPSFARMAGAGGPTNIDAYERSDSVQGTGGKDGLVVGGAGGGGIMIPAIDDVIVEVDVEAGTIVVNPIPGLGS